MTAIQWGTCGRCGRLAPVDLLHRALRHPASENSTLRCLGEGHPSIEQRRAHLVRSS